MTFPCVSERFAARVHRSIGNEDRLWLAVVSGREIGYIPPDHLTFRRRRPDRPR